jgi:predicted RNase H-like HicB family nuclease
MVYIEDMIEEANSTFTAAIKQDGDWWIGWIEEVPGVNCQEATREELIASLQVTLAEALEMNRTEAKKAAGNGFEELIIAI